MSDIPVVSGSSTGTWKSIINTIIGLINGKFNSRPYIWANAAARTAQTGMTIGEYGYQTDTQVTYRATSATATQPWSSPWIAYTATLSGFAIGTGGSALAVNRYKYINGRILEDYKYVFGTSGTTFPTSPKITTSIPGINPHDYAPLDGGGSLYDVSASTAYNSQVFVEAASTTQVRITSNNLGAITTIAPFTWAAGDILAGRFWRDPV